MPWRCTPARFRKPPQAVYDAGPLADEITGLTSANLALAI